MNFINIIFENQELNTEQEIKLQEEKFLTYESNKLIKFEITDLILKLSNLEQKLINMFYYYDYRIEEILITLDITQNQFYKIRENSLNKLKFYIGESKVIPNERIPCKRKVIPNERIPCKRKVLVKKLKVNKIIKINKNIKKEIKLGIRKKIIGY